MTSLSMNKRICIQLTVMSLLFIPIIILFDTKQQQKSWHRYFLLTTDDQPPYEPPNVLIFFVDDWGWGDLGVNIDKSGASSETPYMDAFSKEGIRFTDFHVGSSVCTPSRASLLTGRLGLRNGMVK